MADDKVAVELELLKAAGFIAQAKEVSKTIKGWDKELKAATKSGRAANIPMSELRRVAKLFGQELTGTVNPALNLTAKQLDILTRSAAQAGLGIQKATTIMGASTAQANAFTRAATRGVAALGFISPTAATASAQIVGLTNASAGMTLAIGAAAIGTIALVGTLFKSTKAAIAFESSFRGIQKTVEATEPQFARLAAQNREMAVSLGQNVNTINEIGQAAGQLGIAVGDLAQFEQIVIELASASDISAKAAAFSFGGLIEVLGLTVDDLDSLTDQIVGLGNSFAATESEIVGFLNRISGAGAVLGVTAQDLTSIAAAFASLRIPAEAGGTAIQKVFLAMQKAAVVGGEELEQFASTLRITGAAFRQLIAEDPAAAFVQFVEALSREGPQAQITLEKLGLQNERTRRTFLTAAAAGGHLNEVMQQGARDNAASTARTEEFNKELATTAGQLRQAGAAINEMAISLGDNLLPAVKAAAAGVVALSEAITVLGDSISFVVKAGFGDESALGGIFDITKKLIELAQQVGGGQEQFGDFNIDIEIKTRGFQEAIDELRRLSLISKDFDINDFPAWARQAVFEARQAALAVSELDTSLSDADPISQQLADSIKSGLLLSLESLTNAADEARQAIFAVFKEPSLEEKQATLAVNRISLELAKLGVDGIITPDEEFIQRRLQGQLKTAQEIQKVAKLTRSVSQGQAEIAFGQFQTIEQMNEAYAEQIGILGAAERAVEGVGNKILNWEVNLADAQQALLVFDDLIKVPLQDNARTLIVALEGDEKVVEDLRKVLDAAKGVDEFAGKTFQFSVAVSGAERVIQELLRIAVGANTLIGVLTALRAAFDLAFQIKSPGPEVVTGLPTFTQPVDPFLDLPETFSDAASKVVDPLKDGIITLAEALEFGFTAASAATAELQFETDKLAARYFRVAVEASKLERAERERNSQLEIGLRLSERDIERRKELIELQIEQAVAMAELRAILEGTGLEGNIDTFAFAVNELGEEILKAGESTTEAMRRLQQAATDAVQTQFDALFNKPTREEAQLGLSIAIAERDLSLLIRSGASDELISAKEEEVRQIQTLLDVRRAEEEVIKAQALVVDQTLLTQHEQFVQAGLLIGLIATETDLLDDLNLRLGLEILAMDSARDAVDRFAEALFVARDVINDNLLGPGPGQSRGFGVAGGINVEANFTINADTAEEIKRQINEDLDDALNVAGLAGSNAGTGTFVA